LVLILYMNDTFINKISPAWKALLMQPKAKESMAVVERIDCQETIPKSYELYEEFSQRSISDTIQLRQEEYGKADVEKRKSLEIAVDEEIEDFLVWLSEIKNLEPKIARYYGLSLKSLLAGFEFGQQIAELFDRVLTKTA
jgi:hypothetical protein